MSSAPSPAASAPPTSSPPAASSAPPPSSSSPPPASTSSPPASSSPPPASTSPPPAASTPPPPLPSNSAPAPPPTASPSPPAPPPSSSSASPPPPATNATTTPSVSSPPPPSTSLSPPDRPPPPPPPTSTTTPSSSSSSASSEISGAALIGVVAAAVIAAFVVLVLVFCLCKKKKKKRYLPAGQYGPPGGPPAHFKDSYNRPGPEQQWFSNSPTGSEVLIKMPPPQSPQPASMPSPRNGGPNAGSAGLGNSRSWFTYEELATATGGFSRANLLGQGGFGSVFKGVLPGGKVVAVKQLKAGGGQGEKEFQAEVEIISRVHHRHLVSLVGYCTADSQRLLVYEYVPNGTLEYHLHGKKGGPVMDWPTRLKIACGAARGLAYLHEDCHPRIIHRDIKSSNILLDNYFEAQVSDFGLAKLTSDTNTHVTTRVMGTFGYLAPEYASSGKLTEKSDVFSFGVVLLELLTGRKPVDQSLPQGEESLVEWARLLLKQKVNDEDDLDLIADPALQAAFNRKEMLRMAQAAAACIRHSANKRPRMSQVVRALEDDASFADLSKGLKPGHSTVYGSSFTSTDYENTSYTAEMRRFRKTALESQEFGSEYSGNTSEYGANPSASSSEYQTSREVDRAAKLRNNGKNQSTSSSNEFI